MVNELNHTTIPMLLRNVVPAIRSPKDVFLLHKTETDNAYKTITYEETLSNIDAISSWFIHNGIKKGDRVGLLIENCPNYVFYDQALHQIGAINVSIYPTLSEVETDYVINDSGLKTLLIGTNFLLNKVLKIADNCPTLKFIIPAFDLSKRKNLPTSDNYKIVPFDEILKKGKLLYNQYENDIIKSRVSVLPSDVAAFIYTSGTTGSPKGAMLTHSNFISNVRSIFKQLPNAFKEEERFLSFLPLSHVFERTAHYMCCARGYQIAYAQGLELLSKNMMEVKPTIMATVPRLLERICERAISSSAAAGGVKKAIFNWAFRVGKEVRLKKENNQDVGFFLSKQFNVAEKLVFSKVKEKFGGKMKHFLSAGAALPVNVGEFFANMGMVVLEGYGLTETSPVVTVNKAERWIIGTVGPVIEGVSVAIQNHETKEIYTVQDVSTFDPKFESREGEILVKGECLMKGYWNKPEETKNAIDADGWFHTGDIGRFTKGNLQITDRIKNIIISSFGKNIYPTLVENTLLQSPKIEQIFLVGDKREFLTAIITPSSELLKKTFNLGDDFFAEESEFIDNTAIIKWVQEDIRKLSHNLAKFEHVKHFVLKRRPMSIEAGELTPTLKPKRKFVEEKYAEIIDSMYPKVIVQTEE